jgi:Ca-activated chloride channel homolog
LPAALRAAALALLVVALARPLQGLAPRKDRANVIDIMLCVDVSGSMLALDRGFTYQGELQNRLYVVKKVVERFVQSRKYREEDRFGLDRVGLILYAGYAWTQCPLTLDYAILEHELELAEVDETNREKQGTAIGSAIGLAVNRLRKSEAKSKVIVLVTDGQNNRGELGPLTAARLAKDYGIRVYTIGAGSSDEVLLPSQSLFGPPVPVVIPIDDELLTEIASTTGGQYYRATDTRSLDNAYEEISNLETTEVTLNDYYEHKEGFAPYAAAGTALLLASLFSRRLWFDPIP